jgi:hypothetical protein
MKSLDLAQTIRLMIDAGCDTEQIKRVCDGHAEQEQSKREAQRLKWREVKQKQRLSTVSTKNSVDIVDPSPPNGFPPAPISILNTPPSLTPSPVKRAQRAARLSEDWVPREFEGETVELEKFRDWARSAPGQKGVKADWDATWRNWMRRVRENGNVTSFAPKPKERDLRNIPDNLLSNEDWMRKRMQLKGTWK